MEKDTIFDLNVTYDMPQSLLVCVIFLTPEPETPNFMTFGGVAHHRTHHNINYDKIFF